MHEHITAHKLPVWAPCEWCCLHGTGDPEGREGHVSCSRPAMEDSPEEQIRFSQLERQKGLARLEESFSKHWCLWDDKE